MPRQNEFRCVSLGWGQFPRHQLSAHHTAMKRQHIDTIAVHDTKLSAEYKKRNAVREKSSVAPQPVADTKQYEIRLLCGF